MSAWASQCRHGQAAVNATGLCGNCWATLERRWQIKQQQLAWWPGARVEASQ